MVCPLLRNVAVRSLVCLDLSTWHSLVCSLAHEIFSSDGPLGRLVMLPVRQIGRI
jgi:hypothetical protein